MSDEVETNIQDIQDIHGHVQTCPDMLHTAVYHPHYSQVRIPSINPSKVRWTTAQVGPITFQVPTPNVDRLLPPCWPQDFLCRGGRSSISKATIQITCRASGGKFLNAVDQDILNWFLTFWDLELSEMFQVSWRLNSSSIFYDLSYIQFSLTSRTGQRNLSNVLRAEERSIALRWYHSLGGAILGGKPDTSLESCKHLVLDHSYPSIQDGNVKETWSFRWPWTWRALGWFAKGIMLVGPVTGLLEALAYGMLLRQDCFKNGSEQTQTMWHDCGWILSSSLSVSLGLLKGNYIQANFKLENSMLYKPMSNLWKRRFQTKAP